MARPKVQMPPKVREDLAVKRKRSSKGLKLPKQTEGCWELQWYDNAAGHNGQRVMLTETGLDLVVRMAAQGKHKATVAYCLKLTEAKFQALLNRKIGHGDDEQPDPTKLAWTLGRAMLEDRISGNLLRMTKTQVVAAIYYTKVLGWRDNDPAVQQEGEKHVHIHFPSSQSREEYFAMMKTTHELVHSQKTESLPAAEEQPAVTTGEAK